MGITAFLCVAIGVFPEALYSILPYAVDYQPYTTEHVLTQLQLLFFALLSFAILARNHLEPPEVPSTILDSDWLYRRMLPSFLRPTGRGLLALRDGLVITGKSIVAGLVQSVARHHGQNGLFSRTWMTSSSVLLVLIFLGLYVVFYA